MTHLCSIFCAPRVGAEPNTANQMQNCCEDKWQWSSVKDLLSINCYNLTWRWCCIWLGTSWGTTSCRCNFLLKTDLEPVHEAAALQMSMQITATKNQEEWDTGRINRCSNKCKLCIKRPTQSLNFIWEAVMYILFWGLYLLCHHWFVGRCVTGTLVSKKN